MDLALRHSGIEPVFLKTIRNFRYADNNVDVLIPRQKWDVAVAALRAEGWRYPGKLQRAKQMVIESAKLKMYHSSTQRVPAHIYGGINWRYQTDLGFLPNAADPSEYLVRADGTDVGYEPLEESILIPAPEFDLLLFAAQAVFEDYRIHLGEALYIDGLLEAVTPAQFARVQQIAVDRGFGAGFSYVMGVCEGIGRDVRVQDEVAWPMWFPVSVLARAWRERLRLRRREAGWIPAAWETVGYAAFTAMYYAYKRPRRTR